MIVEFKMTVEVQMDTYDQADSIADELERDIQELEIVVGALVRETRRLPEEGE
jgi:hypothetical protein